MADSPKHILKFIKSHNLITVWNFNYCKYNHDEFVYWGIIFKSLQEFEKWRGKYIKIFKIEFIDFVSKNYSIRK